MRRILLALIMLSMVAGIARAQDAAPKAEAGLTNASLGTMLENLGYEPKDLGNGHYHVSTERDNWKISMSVTLAPSGKHVWFIAAFSAVESPEKVPASVWLALMKENDTIGPAYFAFSGNMLKLFRWVDNRDFTPAMLRREIEGFDSIIRRTLPIWDVKNFEAGMKAPETKAEEKKEAPK